MLELTGTYRKLYSKLSPAELLQRKSGRPRGYLMDKAWHLSRVTACQKARETVHLSRSLKTERDYILAEGCLLESIIQAVTSGANELEIQKAKEAA